jgi:hypothetical protein
MLLVIALVATLSSSPLATQANSSDSLEFFLPSWALQQHTLVQIAATPLFVGQEIVGLAVVYYDKNTDRSGDYLQLYNSTGDLVTVGWFDRFGIERVAVDRGFLEQKEELEGIFVVFLEGEAF